MYRGSSYAVWNFKSCSVVKLVLLYCWDVEWTKQPVLSIAVLFIEGARIEEKKNIGSIRFTIVVVNQDLYMI